MSNYDTPEVIHINADGQTWQSLVSATTEMSDDERALVAPSDLSTWHLDSGHWFSYTPAHDGTATMRVLDVQAGSQLAQRFQVNVYTGTPAYPPLAHTPRGNLSESFAVTAGTSYRLFAMSTVQMSVRVELSGPSTSSTIPVITIQPVNKTAMEGTDVTFVSGAEGTPTPTVQWQTRGRQI